MLYFYDYIEQVRTSGLPSLWLWVFDYLFAIIKDFYRSGCSDHNSSFSIYYDSYGNPYFGSWEQWFGLSSQDHIIPWRQSPQHFPLNLGSHHQCIYQSHDKRNAIALHLCLPLSHSFYLYHYFCISISVSMSLALLLLDFDLSQHSRFMYSLLHSTAWLRCPIHNLNHCRMSIFNYIPSFNMYPDIFTSHSTFCSRLKPYIALILYFMQLKYCTHLWHFDDIQLYSQNGIFPTSLLWTSSNIEKLK